MKLLHTSDWHVGKTIRGHQRFDEHRAVLTEITDIADSHDVDLVLVAGDLFETSAPTPEAEQIAFDALLALASGGRKVAVISGNHDNARRLATLRRVFESAGITLLSSPQRPDDGGVFRFESGGVPVQLAMLPFVSQRGIVRTESLMGDAAFKHAQLYGERLSQLIDLLAGGFNGDSINLLMAHAFVTGGALGGGERPAHISETYQVSAQSFPVAANYVALGHLHRAQAVPGPTKIHYSGSPIQMDFGESDQPKQVNICDVEPGLPAKITPVPLRSGRPLITLRGTFEQVRVAEPPENAWLRVILEDAARPGLSDDVREALGPHVVDVSTTKHAARRTSTTNRTERSPSELFGEYLEVSHLTDKRLIGLFNELLDDQLSPDQSSPDQSSGGASERASSS